MISADIWLIAAIICGTEIFVLIPSAASCTTNFGESSAAGTLKYSALPNPSYGSSRNVDALANHNPPDDNIETNLGKSIYRQIAVSSPVLLSAVFSAVDVTFFSSPSSRIL